MKYYKRTDKNGRTTAVESYSHDIPVAAATEITRQEFDNFVSALPEPEPSPMEPAIEAEFQGLKERVETLEQRLSVLE